MFYKQITHEIYKAKLKISKIKYIEVSQEGYDKLKSEIGRMCSRRSIAPSYLIPEVLGLKVLIDCHKSGLEFKIVRKENGCG